MSAVAAVPWRTLPNDGLLDVIVGGAVICTVPADTARADIESAVDRAINAAQRAAWLVEDDATETGEFTRREVVLMEQRLKEIANEVESLDGEIEEAESDLASLQYQRDELREEARSIRSDLKDMMKGGAIVTASAASLPALAPVTDALVCAACDVPVVYQSVKGVMRETCLLCEAATGIVPFVVCPVYRSDMQRRRIERAA